jgi:hypothetical protein
VLGFMRGRVRMQVRMSKQPSVLVHAHGGGQASTVRTLVASVVKWSTVDNRNEGNHGGKRQLSASEMPAQHYSAVGGC